MTHFKSPVISLLLLLGALISAQILHAMPPSNYLYWLIPILLLLSACYSCFLRSRWKSTWVVLTCFIGGVGLYQCPAIFDAGDTQAASSPGMEYQTLSVPERFRRGHFREKYRLEVLAGLKVSVFAAGLEKPRMLAFGPDGHLYVSLPHAGQVVVLPDRDHDGVADAVQVFADNLSRPHGLVFNDEGLVVAVDGKLLLLRDADRDLKADATQVLSRDLPLGGGHWTRSVIQDAAGDFLVSAGSSCNVCREEDPRRAAILRIGQAGGEAEIHARGLRNSVGLALDPATGEVWASNNGRDMLGDDLPPEEINRIVRGGDYGWPHCYGQQIPDPDFGSPERCATTLPPVVEMPAHSAPLGIAFGRNLAFPEELRQMLYVAFHGSWNRSVPTGYKLVGIPFAAGRPAGPPRDIVKGWLQGKRAWGRPVAPVAGPDGALYLSDDRAGAIYRITARKEGG